MRRGETHTVCIGAEHMTSRDRTKNGSSGMRACRSSVAKLALLRSPYACSMEVPRYLSYRNGRCLDHVPLHRRSSQQYVPQQRWTSCTPGRRAPSSTPVRPAVLRGVRFHLRGHDRHNSYRMRWLEAKTARGGLRMVPLVRQRGVSAGTERSLERPHPGRRGG